MRASRVAMRYNQLPTAMLRCRLVYLGIFQVCCLGARQRDLGGGLGGCSGSRGAGAVTTLCRVRQRGSCEWTLFPTAEVGLSLPRPKVVSRCARLEQQRRVVEQQDKQPATRPASLVVSGGGLARGGRRAKQGDMMARDAARGRGRARSSESHKDPVKATRLARAGRAGGPAGCRSRMRPGRMRW